MRISRVEALRIKQPDFEQFEWWCTSPLDTLYDEGKNSRERGAGVFNVPIDLRRDPVFHVLVRVTTDDGLTGLGAIGLSRFLAQASGQWGWWLTGGVLLSAMAGLWTERRSRAARPPIWLASVDTLIWAMLPFAAFGHWDWGLAAVTAYAAASFAWVETIKLRDDPPQP